MTADKLPNKTFSIFLYFICLLLTTPIIIYLARQFSGNLAGASWFPGHFYIQTFISGPGLFICGLVLFILNRRHKSKFIGVAIMLFGLLWIGLILKAVLEEAQII